MDIRIQLTAIVIMSIIVWNYARSKRLPLITTRVFGIFLMTSGINLVAELATIDTIYHIEIIDPLLNRFCHQVFIGTLNLTIFWLHMYVEYRAKEQKRESVRKFLIRVTPLTISMLMVVFGPLYYYIGEDGRYSYGPMAMTVYVSIFIYVCFTVRTLIAKADYFTKEMRIAILSGITVWLVIAIYQLIHPTALLSSMGVSLMVLIIYLSYENPREYADFETQTLNPRAFHLMLTEHTESKKRFYVINFMIEDVEVIQNMFGYSEVVKVLGQMAKSLGTLSIEKIYHSKSNMISMVISKEKRYHTLIQKLENWDFVYHDEKGIQYKPKCKICVIECPKYAKSVDDVMHLLDYLKKNPQILNRSSRVVEIGEEVIRNKNYVSKVEGLIRTALDTDGLDVYYQPIYAAKEECFVSAEALVRLKDTETLGYISPEIFIPIAEQKGLIGELGNQVFEKVCRFAREKEIWKYGIKYIEVNISGVQGIDQDLPCILKGYMQKYEITPEFINIEITETASTKTGDMLKQNMEQLRALGCHFSMDDFGTGYSNLSQMAKVHFELIKLDKSLIWPCFEEGGTEAKVILENSINMILQLGMKIVAEGVEKEEQVQMLTKLGVNYLQGYFFSKPIPDEQYLAFVQQKNAF